MPRRTQLLTRVLAIKEKPLGLDHHDVALSVVKLAQLRVVQEQPEKAEPLYRRSLAIPERALGPSHPDVAKMLENLAKALRKLGCADEVVSLELRAKNFRAKRS